ncbi:MAG: NAD-dependent DNA ligase LigA [Deltaproteobacteria bacterium]|nr:NAD-dependent DNA ligase LigA [Deltaproteobacteria bacterium]
MSRQTQLRSLIMKAKQAYYYGGQPIMTDAEYDGLEDELRRLAPDDPILAVVGAPVPPDNMLTKATHSMPMGSQSKVNSEEEYRTWHENSVVQGEVHASLKGDGASAAAYYKDGQLTQVISRGDGKVGEDITANAVKFKGLPTFLSVDNVGFSGAVRFEVILTVEDWGVVDPARKTNPRNAGTGIMGRKNGKQSELLTVFALDIDETQNGKPVEFETEYDKSKRLEQLGINMIDYRMCNDQGQVIAYFDEVVRTRDDLPIWIDGVVLKVNSLAQQKELGVTSGRPKGQVAWKFDSVGAETVLKAVTVSGGHTGALIPNAELEPVQIGGTTVSNASLANWEEVKRLGVAVGDRVWVIKANDIIPKIVNVTVKAKKRKIIHAPTECPFCGGAVGRRRNTSGEEGAVTECQNSECPKKSVGKIKRWIKSLDIQGIGDSVRDALIEQFDLEDVADLYRLKDDPARLAALIINTEKEIRLGDKRATTILDAIESARHLTLVQFLGSLGIDRLGKRRVELIAQAAGGALDTLDDWRGGALQDSTLAEKAGVPNIGDTIQASIDNLAEVIDRLLSAGVTVSDFISHKTSSSAGKTICITGKLPSGKKKSDYAASLSQAGFALVDKVTKDLDYLVLDDPNSTSSKAKKARKLKITLLSEEELQKLL